MNNPGGCGKIAAFAPYVVALMPTQTQKSFNLLRWFSALSLLSIGLITSISALLLSQFLSRNILMRDAVVTEEFVQSIAQTDNASRYFEAGHDPGKIKARFEEFFKRVATMPEVVRAIVYGRDGAVIWSDDERFIGHRFLPNAQLEEALAGEIAVRSGRSGKSLKPEHIIDQEIPFFAEIYIPIWDTNRGDVVGVVEVYKVPVTLFKAIERGNRLVWINAGLGGLFLFTTLFWIVRRADRVIHRQQERLVESESMAAVGELASTVAHGIRNPLSSIRSSAEVALEKHELPFYREASSDIVLETDRLENWIRELLAYSKPVSAAPVPMHIDEIIRSTLDSFERDIKKRDVKVEIDLGRSPVVHADEALLRHVVMSLISNAIEAMPNGGLLTVTVRETPQGDAVEVRIQDTGVGIPADKLKEVFKPFYTTKPTGLGVGLSLAKRIIERQGGTITLASRERVGTVVTLKLPSR